jgi:hypothetical protein
MKVRDLLQALGASPGGRDVIYFQAHNTVETVLEVNLPPSLPLHVLVASSVVVVYLRS